MVSDFEFMEKLNARALKDLVNADSKKRKIIKGAILERMMGRILKKKGYKVDRIKTSEHNRPDVIGKDSNGDVKVVIQCTNFGKSSQYHIEQARNYEAQLQKYPDAEWIAVCSHEKALDNIDEKVKECMTIIPLGFDIEARPYHPKGNTSPISEETYKTVKRKVWNKIPHA